MNINEKLVAKTTTEKTLPNKIIDENFLLENIFLQGEKCTLVPTKLLAIHK
jgi:hypothetical protein